MAIFNSKRLAGAGYVVLNVIRGMNIIALMAVMAASMSMLVRTFDTNTFFFFDACEHLTRCAICGFLILTELPFFKHYWMRNWPLFSQSSGFVMLGASMLLIGNSVLACLNREGGSVATLGLPFWRLMIGSGIIITVMGAINIVASYIFRDSTQGLTARQVRSNGATASYKAEVESTIAASTPKQSRRSRYRSFFLKTEKRNSLPSYHSYDTNVTRSDTVKTQNNQQHRSPVSPASPYHTMSPYAQDPVSPTSKYSTDSPRRPDIAHHPAMAGRAF